ncbi:Syntaxin/t-SNARE family protein [Raphanus sativus]|nr:Syntaxin/t-SNARE family protein [Raphanus sativus]
MQHLSRNGDLHAALGTTKWQLDEFQRAVQSSYDNGLKNEIRDRHRESTFAMETQVVKIEKSHKEASKGTPRQVRLDEDDQDDHNELALFLAEPSDPERKQLSTNGVKVNQLQGHRRMASATDDIGAWIAVSDDGVLHSFDEPFVRPP